MGLWDYLLSWLDRVDWARVARGASTGLSILVVVGLASPLVGLLAPWAHLVWLGVGSLAAYVVAALRASGADAPGLTGAFGALFGYALSVPLIYFVTRTFDPGSILLLATVAVVVGGLTGTVMGRRPRDERVRKR